MYHGSRKMLTILIVICLAVTISCGVLTAIGMKQIVGGKFHLLYWRVELIGQTKEEAILSGTYACNYDIEGNAEFLAMILWIITTAWEVLALCLALWIAVKQFRDLRGLGSSAGSTIVDMFTVLIKSHILYFAR
jgi:preprotein translocase subunit SecG